MTNFKKEKINSSLQKISAEFMRSNVEPGTIVSVTNVETSSDLAKADIFVTVFPEEKEEKTISDLSKKVWELRQFVKDKMPMKYLPEFEIKMDQAEKIRRWAEKQENK